MDFSLPEGYASVTQVDEGGTSQSNPTGSMSDLPGLKFGQTDNGLRVLWFAMGALVLLIMLKGGEK